MARLGSSDFLCQICTTIKRHEKLLKFFLYSSFMNCVLKNLELNCNIVLHVGILLHPLLYPGCSDPCANLKTGDLVLGTVK